VAQDAETTIECNPDDITEEYALAIRKMGFNRVSLGAQTFSDKQLRTIRRRHNAEQVDNAIAMLRKAGFQNISIDLMFGFPGETLDQWQSDIEHAISLRPQHISAYSLMYEEGTPLHRMLDEGKIEETDEDLSLQMFESLVAKLTAAGYEHYEISNFAMPSFRSRHNSSYWRNVPYIGLGAAAHSYDLKYRSYNVADIQQYIEAIEHGELPSEQEVIDEDTHYNDRITVALRTSDGLDLTTISDRHRRYCMKEAQRFIDDGLLQLSDNRLSLTRKGLFVSDYIMSSLIMV
jgi:oxygen-independent coproporphyrinogen-3 oxidase